MNPPSTDLGTDHSPGNGPPAAIVVGQGSIGLRHVEVLRELGYEVATVSRRLGADHATLAEAIASSPQAPYVVIATETDHHGLDLDDVETIGFTEAVLVEKPLLHRPSARPVRDRTFVGYNLRFHPAMDQVRRFCEETTPVSVQIHAGQDIRTWRPGREVQGTASATPGSGGVLRDLSHELDYVLWLFGPWKRVASLGGVRSRLGLCSDDVYHLVVEMDSGVIVSVELNYLDAPAHRTIHASSENGSLHADLVAGTVLDRGTSKQFQVERNDTYRLMHQAILENQGDERLCTMEQASRVVDFIDAVERANDKGTWISS